MRYLVILKQFTIHRTNVEYKVSPMVGGDVHIHINGLSHGVHLANHSIAILAPSLCNIIMVNVSVYIVMSHLMRPGSWVSPVVSTHSALAVIVSPLDTEPSTVQLIVIVVHRVAVPKPSKQQGLYQ